MTNRLWATAIERAGVLTAPFALDELPDEELVHRFLASREEQAFSAIVRRHGPLVWGVCRNLLPTEVDAEDAFQATFLALVKSAHQIRQANALGAWLHRVAGRVCRNSLRGRARRRKYEQSAAIQEAARPVDEAAWDRWHAAVHEEIDRLPEALRVPFVLCVLQGLRQPEAAKRLGWKLGTVSGRVCKAKQAVTEAITRRGLVGAVVTTAVIAGSAPISAGLVSRAKAVVPSGARPGEVVSPTVHELARGATGGLMTKTKLLAAVVVAGTLAIGVGSSVLSKADAQTAAPGGTGTGVSGPAGLGGPGGGGSEGGAGGPGGPVAGMPGMPGGAMSGASAARSARIEYHFVARPKGADAFKKLLTQQGVDGWEYVGLVPGDEELIFKRGPRPAGGMMGMMGGGMGMPGMGGFAPAGGGPGGGGGSGGFSGGGGFAGGPGFGTMPGGFGSGGIFGGGSAPGAKMPGGTGAGPAKGGGSDEGSGRPPRQDRGPGSGDGAGGEGAGLAGGGKAPTTISIQYGETIRHKMASNQQIDRVLNHDLKVADVSPDPTDARRVLIKGLQEGGARVELTDSNGKKEQYIVRVK